MSVVEVDEYWKNVEPTGSYSFSGTTLTVHPPYSCHGLNDFLFHHYVVAERLDEIFVLESTIYEVPLMLGAPKKKQTKKKS